MATLWAELTVLQSLIGYCFVIANESIGLYNIRDLNNMKGDLVIVKAHKRFGWIETFFFYVITIQCIIMAIMNWEHGRQWYLDVSTTAGFHTIIGGVVAFVLFSTKFLIAHFKKDWIYRYGQYLGPIGFIGWSLAHWSSLANWYLSIVNYREQDYYIIPQDFVWAGFLPIPIGVLMFLLVLLHRGSSKQQSRWSTHQLAFILHGITFGYEGAAKELLGTPALFKYVVPKTYSFLEKMMEIMGFDMKHFASLTVTQAMEEFMKKASEIGMAEKIQIKWQSDREFTVESFNCSTAKVRSVMRPDELENAVCPWAIIAAAIVNKITQKDLEFDASEFNEIGAKTSLRIK